MRSRKDLGAFLNRHRLLGTGVEVGVAEGAFSRQILEQWRGHKLYLVDCWEPQPPFDYQDIHNLAAEQQESKLQQVHRNLAAHRDRYEVVRAFSCQAVSQFANESLDFVYIDANHKYPFIAQDLRSWWPKIRAGGFLCGMGYIDAVVQGCLFGVKTAVDEFAAEGNLQVRLTYDKLATWFMRKAAPERSLQPRRIGVLTAFDKDLSEIAFWSSANKARYCQRQGYSFVTRTDGFDTSRPPAWSKIKFIREHLGQFEWLFWSDVDSLIMNQTIRLEELIDDEYDAILAMDDPGIGVYNLSTGHMLFKNTDWSQKFLEQVYAQTQFINNRLWEQRALIHLWEQKDFSDHIEVVTQRRMNSYPSNYRKGDFVIHFADLPNDVRRNLMQVYDQFSLT